ncbi:MAG: hypothetical protein MJ200_00860 [Mycoplasmoidaceae bacterium]|nr:hypothetical protein [Mycoplasmoidaceae bacterium]
MIDLQSSLAEYKNVSVEQGEGVSLAEVKTKVFQQSIVISYKVKADQFAVVKDSVKIFVDGAEAQPKFSVHPTGPTISIKPEQS